ncbi:DUF4238 domain-containing protein [Lactovum miscens]|uniref:DUF4238 domain-containing protein n=1 Tax=Lactovum miscens TaxID=190387 RepID=A0A841C7L4_9LACT|nr:DUF4238 domain-containing protein [Lactovum miscens]MBB5887582.1 hypothetical protein [Lactovum miscens]
MTDGRINSDCGWKMSEIKRNRHHYVPKFYLRNFSSSSKSIGTFAVEEDVYIEDASIRTMGQAQNLYGKTNEVEEELGKIETKSGEIIKEIIRSKKLPLKGSKEYLQLIYFIVISDLRTLKMNEIATEQQRRFKNAVIDGVKGDLTKISDEVKKIIDYDEKENSLILLSTASTLQKCLFDLELCLINNNSRNREFITTDSPIIKDNILAKGLNGKSSGLGFGCLGLEIYFPLSPRLCLFLYDSRVYDIGSKNKEYYIKNDKIIDKMNKYFYLNSSSNIYFSKKVTESYLRKNVVRRNKISKRELLDNSFKQFVNSKGEDSLYEFQFDILKEKLNLPFIKLTKYALHVPPNTTAGFYERDDIKLVRLFSNQFGKLQI